MRGVALSGAVLATVALLLGASPAGAEEIEARGTWHDESDGTSGGITLRFDGPNSAVSGNMRQASSAMCVLTDEAGEPAEFLTVTVNARASVTGALTGGALHANWSLDNSGISVTGDPRCDIQGNVSQGGVLEGQISFGRGHGSGHVDGGISFDVEFDPVVTPEILARVETANAALASTKETAAYAHGRLGPQLIGVEQLKEALSAEESKLADLLKYQGMGRLPGEDLIDAMGAEPLSMEQRYLDQLGVVGQARAIVEREEAQLAQLKQEAAEADRAVAAAEDELREAEAALAAD